MLITEQYRAQNARLHAAVSSYGNNGHRHAVAVAELAKRIGAETVLDYGSGKGSLKRALSLPVAEYDPAVPEHSAEPVAADLVVCGDVLEHIEPECLDDVLDHLHSLTKKVGLFVIATRPAKKHLDDGRNAHLIVENRDWWMRKLEQRWQVTVRSDVGGELIVEVTP